MSGTRLFLEVILNLSVVNTGHCGTILTAFVVTAIVQIGNAERDFSLVIPDFPGQVHIKPEVRKTSWLPLYRLGGKKT